MDNFSVRSERNFHNLAAKPKRMHLLDGPSGYASAMVKSSLSHQMRFTVQVLEDELCAAATRTFCRSSCSEMTRASCPAGSSLLMAHALRTDLAPLHASASAREPRCSWICVAMPSRLPSCAIGARGSMSY